LTFSAVDVTLALLLSHFQLKELEESKDDAFDPPTKLTKFAKARDVHEALNDYFSRKMGAFGSPLAYVTRDIVAVAPLVALIATVGFPSYLEQMIARTRHDIPGFASDCATVWGIMRSDTYGGPGWARVSAFQRANNGRAAKLAFSVHYMGDAHTSRIRSEAVRKLQVTFFDGKTRFTMEQYLTVLTSCFTDLLTVGQPYTEVMKMDVLRRTLVAESFKLEAATETRTRMQRRIERRTAKASQEPIRGRAKAVEMAVLRATRPRQDMMERLIMGQREALKVKKAKAQAKAYKEAKTKEVAEKSPKRKGGKNYKVSKAREAHQNKIHPNTQAMVDKIRRGRLPKFRKVVVGGSDPQADPSQPNPQSTTSSSSARSSEAPNLFG
jgi:hypothetical protein